jgi:hypothetical protein
MLRVPVVGETRMLAAIVNQRRAEDLECRLYANDHTPTVGDSLADYVEVTGGGYAPRALIGAEWLIEPGERSIATYPEQTWTFETGVGLIYGYFVVQARSGILMWAERFPEGPYRIEHRGDALEVPPVLSIEGAA